MPHEYMFKRFTVFSEPVTGNHQDEPTICKIHSLCLSLYINNTAALQTLFRSNSAMKWPLSKHHFEVVYLAELES